MGLFLQIRAQAGQRGSKEGARMLSGNPPQPGEEGALQPSLHQGRIMRACELLRSSRACHLPHARFVRSFFRLHAEHTFVLDFPLGSPPIPKRSPSP